MRNVGVAVLACVISIGAFAQDDANGGGRGRRRMDVRRGGFNGNGGFERSILHSFMKDTRGFWLFSGRVPERYSVVGLTPEQTEAMSSLMTQARDEFREMSRSLYKRPERGKRMDPEEMRRRHEEANEKREQLQEKYQNLIDDILTDQQKEQLEKLEAIAEEWQDEDASIRKAMGLAMQQNRENFEEKLEALLTDEQKAALNGEGAKDEQPDAGNRQSEPAPAKGLQTF